MSFPYARHPNDGRDQAEKQRKAIEYIKRNHKNIILTSRQKSFAGLGDFWSDLRDSIIGKGKEAVNTAKTDIQAAIDSKIGQLKTDLNNAVSGGNNSAIAALIEKAKGFMTPESIVALYNTIRIQQGKPPASSAEILGVGGESKALQYALYGITGAAVVFALSKVIKK